MTAKTVYWRILDSLLTCPDTWRAEDCDDPQMGKHYEFVSPNHAGIEFRFNSAKGGVAVMVQDRLRCTLPLWPFSKTAKQFRAIQQATLFKTPHPVVGSSLFEEHDEAFLLKSAPDA